MVPCCNTLTMNPETQLGMICLPKFGRITEALQIDVASLVEEYPLLAANLNAPNPSSHVETRTPRHHH